MERWRCNKLCTLTWANVLDLIWPNEMENSQPESHVWRLAVHHHHLNLDNTIDRLKLFVNIKLIFFTIPQFLYIEALNTHFQRHHTNANRCVDLKNDKMSL